MKVDDLAPQNAPGDGGGLSLVPGRHDYLPGEQLSIARMLRIYNRAVRRQFPMTEERRADIVKQCMDVMIGSAEPELKLQAAHVLIAAERINASRDATALRAAESLAGVNNQRSGDTFTGPVQININRLPDAPTNGNGHG